jgi:hypothetical protein
MGGREVHASHAAVAATHRGSSILGLVSHEALGGKDDASVLGDLLQRRADGDANDVRPNQLLVGEAECIDLARS